VLFDDFQVQNAVTVLNEESCTSGCDSQNRYIKGVWVGYCLRYELPAYSDECLSPTEQDIKAKIETGNYSQDWYCTDDGVYHSYDCVTKTWTDSTNTALCSVTPDTQAQNNQTSSVMGELFDLGAFNFLLSPFMIIMYIAMILAGVISYYTEHWELGGIVMVMVLIGGTLGGIIPAWVIFTIILAIVVLVAFKVAEIGGK
jgi:hypothetical protein